MRAALAGLCALAVAGCATATPPPILTIPVSPALREPCPRPDFQAVQTVGELAAFSVRQEGALAVCEARRGAAVAVLQQLLQQVHAAAAESRGTRTSKKTKTKGRMTMRLM